jgi:D-hydroxyproline dehydrogenase subunit gamma
MLKRMQAIYEQQNKRPDECPSSMRPARWRAGNRQKRIVVDSQPGLFLPQQSGDVMFRKLTDNVAATVTVYVCGEAVVLHKGESAAAAALLANLSATRSTAVSGTPRAPYCMMGVCFECLMTIDGIPSQQGCLVQVREGMRIDRQDGRRTLIAGS